MSLLLFINGQLADLEPGQVIAQTKQVNDLNSLDDRQAGYTNKFRLPKTAHNLKIMQFLTITGNNSNVPYQKNECSLYSETGECCVYKGWAVITDGGDDFEAVVYDGIIDFYKAIENRNLSELGLTDISHTKSIETVQASWINELNYRYILADYNGNTGNTADSEVNIDYLVPSVRVSYLWDKIFQAYADGGYGIGYTGSVFETENFLNLWMTYPKGVTSSESLEDVFVSSDYSFMFATAPFPDVPRPNAYFARFNTFESSLLNEAPQNIHYKTGQAGRYKIEISGKIYANNLVFVPNDGANYDPYDDDDWVLPHLGGTITSSRLFIAKNSQGLTPLQALPDEILFDGIGNVPFTKTIYMDLEEQDSFCIVIAPKTPAANKTFAIHNNTSNLSVKITKINQSSLDFGEALADFSIRDFVTEIVHRFGLTMFKDKYSNKYNFLTLQEHLQTTDVVDWSRKFAGKVNENYIVGTYAQRNWFRYSYNDKESTHHDGYIDIANVNLPDSRNIIQSKVYAPEKQENRTTYLNRLTNVYKLWDKEIVEDPGPDEEPYTYKALDKRFFLLRAEPKHGTLKLSSKELAIPGTPSAMPYFIESYWKLRFQDIIKNYYRPLEQLLDRSVLVNAELLLSDADIASLDFRKLYYIEQLSSYFLINKVSNYVPGRPVKCELVLVRHDAQPEVLPNAEITGITLQNGNHAVIDFDINADFPYTLQGNNGGAWLTVALNPQSPFTTTALNPDTYSFRIICFNQVSNIVSITVG